MGENINTKQGYTIIERLITFSIVCIILYVTVPTALNFYRDYNSSKQVIEEQK